MINKQLIVDRLHMDIKKRAGKFSKAIWWIGGAVPDILELFPWEYTKYYGIGGAILGTWWLATLSSYYAFIIIIGDNYKSIIGSICIGLLIMNLDRMITISMKKRGSEAEPKLPFEEMNNFLISTIPAIPRIFVSIILGVLIAVPLELNLFKTEVNEKLIKYCHEMVQKERIKHDKEAIQNSNKIITDLQNQVQLYTQDTNNIQNFSTEQLEQYKKELERIDTEITRIENNSGLLTSKIPTYNKSARDIKLLIREANRPLYENLRPLRKRKQELQSKIDNINTENRTKQSDIEEESRLVRKNIDLEKQKIKMIMSSNNSTDLTCKNTPENSGLLDHIDALYSLGDNSNSIKWSLRLIILFIVFIDTGPVLAKIIMPRGAYDAAIDALNIDCMIKSDGEIEKKRRQLFMD